MVNKRLGPRRGERGLPRRTSLGPTPLCIDRFGQTGNLADLYRAYRLDADAIVEAAAEPFLDSTNMILPVREADGEGDHA